MKIVLLNVEQAQSIYRSQMVRDFPACMSRWRFMTRPVP